MKGEKRIIEVGEWGGGGVGRGSSVTLECKGSDKGGGREDRRGEGEVGMEGEEEGRR